MNDPAPAPAWLVFAIIGGFIIVFPLFWCGIVWLLSHLSGWQTLARHHLAGERTVAGQRHDSVTGMVGTVSYRHVLTVHLQEEGFFIEPFVLFRIGHPRLFIPWREISSRSARSVLWWQAERLAIGSPTVGSITLPVKVLETAPAQPSRDVHGPG